MSIRNDALGLDAAAFPHIYDEVIDNVTDAETLKSLRLTSQDTRRRVDRRLADHLLLRYDGVRSRLGGVKRDEWADAGEFPRKARRSPRCPHFHNDLVIAETDRSSFARRDVAYIRQMTWRRPTSTLMPA